MTTTAPPQHRAGVIPAQPTTTSTIARSVNRRSSSSGKDPRIKALKDKLRKLTPADFLGTTGYRTADIRLFAQRVAAGVAFCELRREDWRSKVSLLHFDVGDTDCCLRAMLSSTDFDMACRREGTSEEAAVSLGFYLVSRHRHGLDQARRYELLTAMWRKAGELWPECAKVT